MNTLNDQFIQDIEALGISNYDKLNYAEFYERVVEKYRNDWADRIRHLKDKNDSIEPLLQDHARILDVIMDWYEQNKDSVKSLHEDSAKKFVASLWSYMASIDEGLIDAIKSCNCYQKGVTIKRELRDLRLKYNYIFFFLLPESYVKLEHEEFMKDVYVNWYRSLICTSKYFSAFGERKEAVQEDFIDLQVLMMRNVEEWLADIKDMNGVKERPKEALDRLHGADFKHVFEAFDYHIAVVKEIIAVLKQEEIYADTIEERIESVNKYRKKTNL
ncbi:hypothetical protein COB57_04440 [Candidatus Peregrinibacteria bacterium]|nr:MAG: hypothetical protein COB57_04440 [Candidatus Peregrinibacteria bacterium]